MAAIIPHLEVQDDPTETPVEEEYFDHLRDGQLRGLGQNPGKLEREVLDESTANLTRMAWSRLALLDTLDGQRYELLRHEARSGVVTFYLHTRKPSGPDPRWNPPGAGTIRNTSLLSWTSKMGCPSFSLPAGSTVMAGTCPGADAGQSIVPIDKLLSAGKAVRKVTGRAVNLAGTVCQHCYAEGGNYAYGSNTRHQVIRHMWTVQALKDGSFVPVMVEAIDKADYVLDGGMHPSDKGKSRIDYAPERHPGRYFRIHDSGDFFSREYLEAWKEIAERLPDITFWAPSRIWATEWGIRQVNRINGTGGKNLIIRPSSYQVNDPVPDADLGPGWASWTVVFKNTEKPIRGPRIRGGEPYDWDCQAYAVNREGHTCRAAQAPDGRTGCRACWRHTELSVNYTFH